MRSRDLIEVDELLQTDEQRIAAYSKPARLERKKRNAKFRVLQEKRKTQSCTQFFDDNDISFFFLTKSIFSKHFCVRLERKAQFCVWLAVSLFWVSCTRSNQDVLTFQTFLWLLKWRSQIYFLQGLLSNAHSQPLQPINSRGWVTCVFLSLRTALFSGLFIAKTFPFRYQALNVVK